jgi:flagellar hook-associated protein 1 FlgK
MSLFANFSSTSNALSAFESALTVTQNNVSNASTPGYAKQIATFESLPFTAGSGEAGGVELGPLQSSRNEFAEMNVRDATSRLGYYEQQVSDLTPLNNQFDVSGNSGVPAAFNGLFTAFGAWAASPNNPAARQGVINQAQAVASAFNAAASNLSGAAQNTDGEISDLTSQVNQLTSQLAGYNAQLLAGNQVDPSVDAAVNNTLERLSEIASVVTIKQPNGTFSVMLGGQTELVQGATVNKLTAAVYVPTTPIVRSGASLHLPANITTGVNDALNLKVDGTTLSTIKLSPNDKSASDIAADINTQLAAMASTATASIDANGGLVLTSGSTGTSASVEVLSGNANTTLGLTVAGPPQARITDPYGTDVTSQVTGGKLAGALNVRNQILAGLQGNSSETGSLNELARTFADRVNSVLGSPLLTYDQTSATKTAATLQANPAVTAISLPTAQVTALTGTAVSSPLTITAGANDTLNLQIDGNAVPAITLNPADGSLSDVAADLNTQFSALGVGAQASLNPNTGALVLATTNTGTTGSIQLLSGTANATLGLTSTTPTYQNAANSIALNLAALANPSSAADQINGQSFTAYFGSISASVGSNLSDATNGQSVQNSMVTQAQTLRQQISGVDLNEEATRVLQLQSAYEAASKMITVLDQMAQSVLAIIPQS